VKSRKFLTKECSICLESIHNESMCRLLSCYHIFHVECIDSWFLTDQSCPNCKKAFFKSKSLRFDQGEFLQTINVDNECFFSDHLILDNHDRLASTNTIDKYDPFFKAGRQKRRLSFDLANMLRKHDKVL